MSDEKRPGDEHTDHEPAEAALEHDGATDPDDLPDGSGSDGGPSRTADGGDDDQFQG